MKSYLYGQRVATQSLRCVVCIALGVLSWLPASGSAAPPKKAQTSKTGRQAPLNSDPPSAVAVDRTIELPKRGSNESVRICELDAEQVALRIESAEGNPLNFRAISETPNKSWTISDGARKIAAVTRNGNLLELTWSSTAPDDAECLRNSVLCVTQGETTKYVGMRQAVEIDAPLVDLSKDRWAIPVEADLHGLTQKSLKIDVEGLVNNTPKVEALYPADGRANFGKKVRVALYDKPPHAGIQLGLQADKDGCAVKVEPIILDFAGKSRPWTITRLQKFYKTFVTTISKQQRDIPALKVLISNLDRQLSTLRSQLKPGALNELIVRQDIDTVSADLARARNNLARMEASLPVNIERVKALAPLDPLSKAVHQQAKLSFRVYYLVGNTEIVVMTIGSKESIAKRSSAAID